MVTLADIQQAQQRIAPVVHHTPLVPCAIEHAGEAAWFKPESLQPIGSFKIRGAYNCIAALLSAQPVPGVIAYSSGNHAQGVAFAARALGIPAVIVMPTNAPPVKIAATRGYGAEVVLYDPATERREEIAQRLLAERPWALVPPFNDPAVIAGQGTIGLEILADLPAVDLVLMPVGGGGLLSGVATALKSLKPEVKVFGVEPEVAADARASWEQGQIVELSPAQAMRTIADGVRTLSVGDLTLAQMRHYADGILTVSEAEIRDATCRIILNARLVVEPTAALPYAAYLYHRAELPAARTVVMVLTGGNISPTTLCDLLREHGGMHP